MSGTSLDGLDMVYVKFIYANNRWSFTILDAQTLDYDHCQGNWGEKLKQAYDIPPEGLEKLNIEYAQFLGSAVKQFLRERPIDLIGSHGHTIHHKPQNGMTFQLGNHQALARTAGVMTVGNFRVQDVALGGQGAPLVPVGDQILFTNYDYCLNLGGFSNLSFTANQRRIAYDISPCNMLLNQISAFEDQPFDEDGKMAARGKVVPSLLEKWNALDYYEKAFPKSLGREWYQQYFAPTITDTDHKAQDLMATAVEHIAIQIGKALKTGECLTTGGGAKNSFLIKRIQAYSKSKLVIPSEELVDFKEALIFALLAVLRSENKVNVLASVTGANHDHSSGDIYLP